MLDMNDLVDSIAEYAQGLRDILATGDDLADVNDKLLIIRDMLQTIVEGGSD